MRTNLLLILPLVFMALVARTQPQTIGYLYDMGHVSSSADVGGVLYFSSGKDLYRVMDHSYAENFAAVGWDSEVVNMTDVNGVAYFVENRPDASALWRINETGEIVQVIEFTNTFSQISPPVHVEGIVYFGFQDKLYRSDGTEAGTSLVRDLGSSGDQGFLRLWEVDGSLYIHFRKSDMDHELWHSDGTAAGTTLVDSFTYIEFLQELGSELFFVGDDGLTGRELWKVSGATTTNIYNFDGGGGHGFAKGGNPSAAGNGSIVFATIFPEAVWMANSSDVQQLSPLGASEIVFAGGKFVFIYDDDVWATGGTYNTTSRIKIFDDIHPGYPRLTNLTGLGNSAFFVVDGMQLWQTDGTAEGTIILYDHTPSGTTPSGTMTLATAGGHLYYVGTFASNNEPAWQSDVFAFNPNDVWVPSIQLVDASTDQDIRTLGNPAVVFMDKPISIRADASLATSKVVFALNGKNVRTENARPYSLAGDSNGDYNAWNVEPGEYELRITPYDASGSPGQSVVYNITVVSTFEGCGTGTLVRDIWTGITGNQVSLIPRNRRPTGTEMLSSFEGPTNSGTNYGARIKGYICPPETGEYTFWISSNDHSELWLSTDDDPVNKVRIAHVGAATNPRQWDKFPTQQSTAIHLQAGRQYYIEAWHKQGVGTDHVAVGWQLPGGELERPIPGNRLSPFTGNHPPEVRIPSPVEGQVFAAPANIKIETEILDTDGFPTMIRYYAGTTLLRETTDWYYEWTNVPAGSYKLYIQVTDNDGATNTSDTVNIVVTGQCTASGGIGHERWNGVEGSSVSDIPVNEEPDQTMDLSSFEVPANAGIHYGARVRGYVCPPATGDYVFWISSNDHSELWLSSYDDPVNKTRIAWVTGATNPQQWNKFNSQRSSPITLVQGKKYYIEALHKQGVGTDHMAVGWALPDGTLERPIAGNRLSSFGETTGPLSFMTYPADGAADIDPMIMKLQVEGVVGAQRYTIELIPDGGGPAKTLTSIDDYQTTFIVRDLEHATTYDVRVKTDVSGFGPVNQFTTRDPIGLHRLWGITSAGGADGLGTIFSYSIDSARFVKHYDQLIVRYEYGEGEDDYVEYEEVMLGSPIAGPDGTLYGQRDHVYSSNLFVMDKNAQIEWLDPILYINQGNIMLGSNNEMFVTTAPGLVGGDVDRYNLMKADWSVDLRVFNQREFGWDPRAVLIEHSNGYLYGTTREGGINNGGVLYRLRPSGASFEIIHYFDSEHNGMNPFAGLTESEDGYLYGTTSSGGIAGGHGTVFRIMPDGSGFEKLHDFDGWNGRQPKGELLVHDGVVYGMTTEGGAGNHGVVFRINPGGSGFMKLHEFSGNDGSRPAGAPVLGPDEQTLYAMTTAGGANNMGVIFGVSLTGSAFNKLYDFSSWSGGRPEGTLVMREDTFSPSSAMARMASDEERIELSIHPNPTTQDFNVHVKAPGGEKIQMVVTDQYGQVITGYEITNGIPVQIGSELQRGLYIMKIIQGNRTTMKRLVKE